MTGYAELYYIGNKVGVRVRPTRTFSHLPAILSAEIRTKYQCKPPDIIKMRSEPPVLTNIPENISLTSN